MNPGGFSSFGTGTGFGSTSTSLFGSSQPATSSIFGSSATTAAQPQQASLFSGGGFGGFSSPASSLGQPQSGTTIKFAAPTGQDTINKNGSQQTINTNHQCITAMKEYKAKSLEELRFEDYQANRKTGQQQQTSAFGASTSSGLFGSSTAAAQPASTGFGGSSTSLFGGSTAQNASRPLLFGGTQATTAAQPATTSLFGQSSTQNKSIFGASSTSTTSTGFGGFGASQPTTSVFGGAQPAASQPSIFGGLGQTSTATPASTSLFGSTSTTQPSTGGIFGSSATTAAKPAFGGFGSSTTAQTAATTASPFSFSAQPAATGTSIFGSTAATTQSPLSAAKPFGSTGFGSSLGGASGGFGQTSTATTGGGIFGSTAAKPATGFGSTTSTGFGGFGSTATATAQPATGGGIFGGFGSSTSQPAATASPFGAAAATTASPFGQSTATTGIFGQSQPAQAAATTGTGLFGNSGSTGGFGSGLTSGFGSTTVTGTTGGFGASGSIFGNTSTTQAQPASTFSLGGANTGTSLLGNTSLTGGFGSGLTGQSTSFAGFGNMSQQTQQQQQLQQQQQQQALNQSGLQAATQQQISALSNSPYGMSYQHMKKEEIFNPVSPLAQQPYIAEATSPLRLTSILTDVKGGLSQSLKIAPKPLSSISLNKKTDLFEGLEDEETPCFYPRKNIKKLLFKPTVKMQNLSGRSSPSNSLLGDHKPDIMRKSAYETEGTENMGLGRFGQANATDYSRLTTDHTNLSDDGHGNHGDDNQSEASNQPGCQHPANIVLDRPGYFTIPSMQELASMVDNKGDCLVENFSIGRVDYGCITFPGVTNVSNLNLDEIVHIRRKEVHIYPDETKKPVCGQGLNKTAEVTLHRIWPTDKETKKPVTDPSRVIDMGYNKKIERATQEMGAQFIDYDPTTGSWTFKVKHFSKYGLHDSDDEDGCDKPVAYHQNNNQLQQQQMQQATNPIKLCNNASSVLANKMGGHDMDMKQEKDMIAKQLKLIETRRLELMQQRKAQTGNNLNTITNQQWEMLNEYVPQQKGSYNNDQSNVLHLELSEESQIINTDDEDAADKRSTNSCEPKNKTLRKALALDLDNETSDTDTDFDKENTHLFPSLDKYKRSKKLNKNGIYPNLNGFDTKESNNYQMEHDTQVKQSETITEDEHMNGLPFIVAASNDRMLASTRANKTLMKAFFGEEQATEEYMGMLEEDTKAKIAGLVGQKQTQQFGLLKRGLGGLTNEELMESKMSFVKREPHHVQTKPSKITAMNLTEADVQQRIGSKSLKPKNWNRYSDRPTTKLVSLQKHANKALVEAMAVAEADQLKALRLNDKQATGETEVVLKYVALEESVVNGMHRCIADMALSQSRRFRVNWSFNTTACTFTSLALNLKETDFFRINLSAPNMGPLGNSPMLLASPSSPSKSQEAKMNTLRANCEHFLRMQLDLSEHSMQGANSMQQQTGQTLNLFRTKLGNELIKQCTEFIKDMRNTIVGDHPDADNVEHMKAVWTLCQSLWGDIPDNYRVREGTPAYQASGDYEREQIRKRLLSEWLVDVSGHRVERECKMHKFNKNKDSHLNSIFSLLTGNRLLEACKLAAECHDYRLAMLLAQSSGGNEKFRTMLKKQIDEWLSSGSDKYLNTDRLKFYVLISGALTLNSETNTQLINVCENLDWKRQYGLHLWYNCLPVNSIHDSLNQFEQSLSNNLCNKPLPPYLEDSVSISAPSEANKPPTNTLSKIPLPTGGLKETFGFTSGVMAPRQEQKESTRKDPYDTCFHLIKLYCDNKYPIADIISPSCHGSNQLDYRLSWHLAMALISMNYSYVSKECMETLHESYATQLQSFGLWHWSVFVLMHIDDANRRETCVRSYLSRYVTADSELTEKERFVVEKLAVPAEWIYSYKALRAKYEHVYENQFKLLLKAHQWNEAHSVLVELIAPDMFIKQNLKLLNDYLVPLSKESESINKWNLGGQVYLDAIRLSQKAQFLFDFSRATEEQDDTKILSSEFLKEINDQIMSLSTRIKDLKDLDCSTEKKLLVCIQISRMLINFFNILTELNSSDLNQMADDSTDEISDDVDSSSKKLTKTMCEKAFKLTDSIPYHEIIQTMVISKTTHTRTYLMSYRPY